MSPDPEIQCDQCGKAAVYRLYEPSNDRWMEMDFCSLECLRDWVNEGIAIEQHLLSVANATQS
jgi:hypothetical protein